MFLRYNTPPPASRQVSPSFNPAQPVAGAPQRLTFGTAFDQGASLATAGPGSATRLMAFASLIRKENIWSLALDTDHPGQGTRPQFPLIVMRGSLNVPSRWRV